MRGENEDIISLAPYVTDVRCQFEAFPGKDVPARVKEIGTEPSPTTRTYPVTLIMDQPADFTILPGMSGKVTGRADLPEGLAEKGLEIPSSAVFQVPDGTALVWIIDESTMQVKKQAVTLGEPTARGIRVVGIEPGALIATAGVHYLEEGQKVKLAMESTKEVAQ